MGRVLGHVITNRLGCKVAAAMANEADILLSSFRIENEGEIQKAKSRNPATDKADPGSESLSDL